MSTTETGPLSPDLLKSWDEEPLHSASRKWPAVYRLFVSPTFSAPLLFRITRHGKGWNLIGKMKNGLAGYFQGELAWAVKRRLSDKESKRLDYLLQDLQFWSMPSTDSRRALVDGTSVVLEGARAGQYHRVERDSPTERPFMEFADYLRVVSGAGHYLLSRKGQEQIARAFRTVEDEWRRICPQAQQPTPQAIKRLNKTARRFAAQILNRGMCCPHCHNVTQQIRFVEKDYPNSSFFVCKLCARSFGPGDLPTLKLLRPRAGKI